MVALRAVAEVWWVWWKQKRRKEKKKKEKYKNTAHIKLIFATSVASQHENGDGGWCKFDGSNRTRKREKEVKMKIKKWKSK